MNKKNSDNLAIIESNLKKYNVRKPFLEALDRLNGKPIGNNLSEIEMLLGLDDFELLKEKQRPVLENLLEVATRNSSFYAEYKGCSRLGDFPVLDKFDIKENFKSINIPLPERERSRVSTSGSTGTPFQIFQCNGKRRRNTADVIFFARKAGFEIGHLLLYLRFWAAYYKKPRWKAFLQNINQIDVGDLSDDYLHRLLKKIKSDKRPKGWLGYPSGFDKIVRFLEKRQMHPLECNVQSIIGMSEYFPQHTRDKISFYFNCPAVSRYSNVENGIIAQQMPGETSFMINWASYFIEILELKTNNAAIPGKPGRIVITDLFNHATPMIRYDTGDIGVLESRGKQLPELSRIEGRKSDILTNTQGELISPFIFHASLEKYQELDLVQIVQDGMNYTFRIKTDKKPFSREKSFLEYYVPYFGEGARVDVNYINEIPNLKSGKQRLIINLSKDK